MTEPRVLITGASAGLGAEFARQLAARSRDLVLVARRIRPMEQLRDELHDKYNVAIDIIQSDLSVAGEPERLYNAVAEREIAIDFLVNNAGSAGPDLLHDREWPVQERYIELMMTSVAAMCHHFIPPMQLRGKGQVINVASVAGLVARAGDYSYGPTKAYLVALSRALSLSVKADGVNVMALCPGFTHTDFHASRRLAAMKKEMPKFLWYDADIVVREGLRAAAKGRAVYTSGRLYRWTVPILQSPLGRALSRFAGTSRSRDS